MNAKHTKHLIDSMVDKILHRDNHLSNTSILNAHLAASDRELLELERLAEIGKAVEAATLEGYSWVTGNGRGEYSYPNDEDVRDLVSWHKGDMSTSECTNNKAMNKNQEVQRESCSHAKTFTYNHGYHKVCEDCGEEL